MPNLSPIPATEEEVAQFSSPPTGMDPIQATPEEIELFSGPPDWMKPVPISDEDILWLIDSNPEHYPNLGEFEAYRKAKKDEEGRDLLSMAGDAASMVFSELWGGLKSAASHGFYAYQPELGLKTLASGYLRGSTDVMMLLQDIFTKDFYAPDTYEEYLEETGSSDTKDSQLSYYELLRDDLQNFNVKKAMVNTRQEMREGKQNVTLPFGVEIEGEDVKGAEALGYVADWTAAIPVVGWGGKAATKTASAIARTGGKAVGGIGRLGQKITGKVGEKIAENIPGGAAAIPLANRVAGGSGLGVVTGNPWITAATMAPEMSKTADVAGRLAEKVGEQMAKGPSQFGVLERVAMSKTTDPRVRRLARVLSAGGVGDKLLSGTGRVAIGTGTGMAIGAGLGGLAQGWEGAAQGLGAGFAIGGPATLATIGGMKLTGAERRARETGDIMRLLSSQIEKGVNPKEALAKLGKDALLKTATLEKVFQGEINITILDKEAWKGNPNLKGGAAAWDAKTKTIYINMDSARAKHNILHEFGHALFDSGLVDKNDIHTQLHGIYGEKRIKEMAGQYLEKITDSKKRAELAEKHKDADTVNAEFDKWKYTLDESVPPTLKGEPGRSLSPEYNNLRDNIRDGLAERYQTDWYISEIFAEEFVGATIDRNINQLRKGNIPIGDRDMLGLRGAFLRTKASIFRRLGVPIDANGRVDRGYASKVFGEMSGDRKFKQSLRNYIKDRSRHLDHKAKKASKAEPGVMVEIKNLGDHPAANWRSRGDGSFETDFLIKTKEGRIIFKDAVTIARDLVGRREDMITLRAALAKKGMLDRSDGKTFGLRQDIDGKERVSGQILPEEILNMASLPQSTRDYLLTLQEMINTGQTVVLNYSGISTTQRGSMTEVVKYKKNAKGERVDPDLRGTTRLWNRILRQKKGNVKASRREVKPLGFTITKEGNLTMQILDVDGVQAKAERWHNDTNSRGEQKLSLWRNDLGEFYDDMAIYLRNYKDGKGGAEGIGETKRDVFRAFFMQLHKAGGVSPVDKVYNNRPLDRRSNVKDFRMERVGTPENTFRDDFYFDYEAKRWNLMPDGTPRVIEHGQQVKINEAMAHRFMPAPDGAKHIDLRDLAGEGPLALSIDRLGHGVLGLASGAKSQIPAQGGRAFMWLEGKWASYDPTPLVQLVNALKSAGTEYVALSMLGELNHNKTRYGMRLFAESVIDAVNRGEMTIKKADAYVAAMTDFSAGRKVSVSGKMKPFETSFPDQHRTLQKVKSLEELIHYIDAAELTHKAGEVLADTRALKTGKPIDPEGKFYKKHGKAIVTQEAAEAMGFGPNATARLAVDQGLWDEKKYPIGTIVAIMKVKHDAKVSHEPNLHYHYPHTIDVEPIGYLPEFYELKSVSRGLSRKAPEPGKKRGTVYSDTGAVSPNPLMQIKPELDLLKEGNIGNPIRLMPETVESWSLDSYSVGMNMHSRVEQVTLGGKVPNKGGGDQMLATIKKQPGVKQDELDWLGIEEFLKGKKSVTKDELLDHIKRHDIQLEEVTYKADPDFEVNFYEQNRRGPEQDGMEVIEVQDQYSNKEFEITVDNFAGNVYVRYQNGQHLEVNAPVNKQTEGDAYVAIEKHLREEAGEPLKFSGYVLGDHVPGSNREVLFVLPDRSRHHRHQLSEFERKELEEMGVVPNEGDFYQSQHWSPRNVLAHLRFNERTGPNGEKILFIEEIQSDWHGEGRRHGYKDEVATAKKKEKLEGELDKATKEVVAFRNEWLAENKDEFLNPINFTESEVKNLNTDPHRLQSVLHRFLLSEIENKFTDLSPRASKGAVEYAALDRTRNRINDQISTLGRHEVPDAPFKNSWHELVLKRVLGLAAHGKFDKVAWINGAETVKRYPGIQEHFDTVRYMEEEKALGVYKGGEIVRQFEDVPPEKVADYIGAEPAKKLLSQPGELLVRVIEGNDLKMGGEWAYNLYDRMVPQFLKKYGKKFGAKVGDVSLTRKSNFPTVRKMRDPQVFQGIDVTPKMAESHARFMPEFKGSTDPVMGQARRDNVTGKDWDEVVDSRKPVTISPIPKRRDLLSDKGSTIEETRASAKNFKKGMKPIKASLQLLNKKQRELIGATRQTPEGTRVGLRQDIHFRRRTKEWAKAGVVDRMTSAWAIHDAKSPGKGPEGFDTIARIKNVEMFIERGEGTRNRDVQGIAAGKVGKFPMATLEGDWVQLHDRAGRLKKDALPSPEELGDTSKWIEIGTDPHRHEYFYRKDNHRVPIESASEAIVAADAAYVRNDRFLVEGDRSQYRYYPAEHANLEVKYQEAVDGFDVGTMQAAVDRAAAIAGRAAGEDPIAFDEGGGPVPLHDRFGLESDDYRYMPEPAVTSQDGSVRTVPTKGRVVRTGKAKFRVYNLNGKLLGVAVSEAAADALLNRGKK